MIYYIADMHFGHTNVLRFDNRPFPDTAQMDDTLIQNWNGCVTSEDTVYVLGIKIFKTQAQQLTSGTARFHQQHDCKPLWMVDSKFVCGIIFLLGKRRLFNQNTIPRLL